MISIDFPLFSSYQSMKKVMVGRTCPDRSQIQSGDVASIGNGMTRHHIQAVTSPKPDANY